jgi:hypothetical protein
MHGWNIDENDLVTVQCKASQSQLKHLATKAKK